MNTLNPEILLYLNKHLERYPNLSAWIAKGNHTTATILSASGIAEVTAHARSNHEFVTEAFTFIDCLTVLGLMYYTPEPELGRGVCDRNNINTTPSTLRESLTHLVINNRFVGPFNIHVAGKEMDDYCVSTYREGVEMLDGSPLLAGVTFFALFTQLLNLN